MAENKYNMLLKKVKDLATFYQHESKDNFYDEITDLIEEIDPENKFPLQTIIYFHSTKEEMYNKGKEIGLSSKALKNFMYCCYEVGIELEVYKDGTYKILGVRG